MNNLKFITITLLTFVIAFATSLLLDLEIFKNPVRYILVLLFIALELLTGALLLKAFLNKK